MLIETFLGRTTSQAYQYGTQHKLVKTRNGAIYAFDILYNSQDSVYRKSVNGGLSWGNPVTIKSGQTGYLSVWYDEWSNISTELIHITYSDVATTNDVFYKNLDTSSDTLSGETTIFAGASIATGGYVSICRARGGNLGCIYCIDAGAEHGFSTSTDVGANWVAKSSPTEGATTDQWILLPGWAADNQDMICIFWDASVDEISRKNYDSSGNSWATDAENVFATGMVDLTAFTASANFSAAVDIANSQNVLVAWSATDTANADLRCWTITEASITEKTNVVLNSTDDQGLCSIQISTSDNVWTCFYCGKSDGSETWGATYGTRTYYKYSTDSGTTWSDETLFSHGTTTNSGRINKLLCACPRVYSGMSLLNVDGTPYMWYSTLLVGARPTCRIGV